jgi:hypothetical protein
MARLLGMRTTHVAAGTVTVAMPASDACIAGNGQLEIAPLMIAALEGDKLAGMAVHIAARIQAAAEPGEILVSSTVKDLAIGSNVRFSDKGEKSLKGVPDPWRVYAIAD